MAKGYKPCAVWDWKIMSPNSGYKVIISERAADMLIQHVRFMAQESPEAADKLRAEIYRSV